MKRNAIFCAVIAICWIIVLSIAPLRNMFLAQTFRASGFLPSIVPTQAEMFYDREITPASPEMKGFPDDPVAVATFLIVKFNKMHSIRLGGELSDAKLSEHQKEGIPSPERRDEEPDYTQEQWQEVIEMCKRGQELAPDNAYFDVVEAYWQFAEFHDDAVWIALRRANKKPLFDTYKRERAKRRVDARQAELGRQLLWEESLNYAALDLPSRSVVMREMWRWLAWEGIKAQRKGEQEKAAEIYTLSLNVSQLWFDSSEDFVEPLVADAMNGIILGAPRHAGVTEEENAKGKEQMWSIFTNYAKNIHRPDLLKYVKKSKENGRQKEYISTLFDKSGAMWKTDVAASSMLWLSGVAILWLLIGSLIAGILSAMIKVLLYRGNNRENISETIRWRSALSLAAFPASFIALLFLIYNGWWIYRDSPGYIDILLITESQFLDSISLLLIYSTVIIFSVAFCVKRAAQLHRKKDVPKVLLWQQILSVITSIIFSAGWIIFIIVYQDNEMPSLLWLIPGIIISIIILSLLETCRKKFSKNIKRSILFDIFSSPTILIIIASIVSIYFLIYKEEQSYKIQSSIIWGIIMLGIAIFLFGQYRAWRQTDDIKSTFRDFLHLMSGGALRWLALGSILYVLTLYLALPVRAPMNQYVDVYINKGEIAALEMQK